MLGPDQLTSAGELVTGHLIQPVVETLSQVADGGLSRARPTSSLSASMNSSGALPSGLHQHINLSSRDQALLECKRDSRRLGQSVRPSDQSLRLAGMKRHPVLEESRHGRIAVPTECLGLISPPDQPGDRASSRSRCGAPKPVRRPAARVRSARGAVRWGSSRSRQHRTYVRRPTRAV